MSTPRLLRRASVLALAMASVVALSSCTPSHYAGASGTVAIQARKLGIPLSASAVSCHPTAHDQFMHKCTAPVGKNGAKVVLDVRVGSIVTATEKTEAVVVTIPVSLARNGLHRTEAGWTYVTQCGWRADSKGKWAVDPAEKPRTFLVDENGQGIKEV